MRVPPRRLANTPARVAGFRMDPATPEIVVLETTWNLDRSASPKDADPADATARNPPLLAAGLMFASGAAGLGWQMVWTTGFGVALGHEIVAVLAVLAAFFAGLAAGSFLLAARIESSRRPGRWYSALEALAAAWGLCSTLGLPALQGPLARTLGAQPGAALHAALAWLVPLVLLMPATIAMGATLPAIERQLRTHTGAALAWLYAANTAGAVAGLAIAVFVGIPNVGLRAMAIGCAVLNLVCAGAAAWAWRRPVRDATPHAKALQASGAVRTRQRRLAVRLFATGLLGIGYEVLVVRVLSQVTQNTVYTYAILLAGFLVGTAAGAAWWARRKDDDGVGHALHGDRLLALVGVAMLASGCTLWWADVLQAWPARTWPGLAGALSGEACAALFAMLAPSFFMGALFSQLCRQASASGLPLGRAVGWNTLGAALAPVTVAAVLMPVSGARGVLVLLVMGYLALRSWNALRLPHGIAIAAAALLLALLAPPLRFIDVPAGGRVLSHREDAAASVDVVVDAADVMRLHINNRVQEGSTASGLVEMRLAQLPLLMHARPRRALFLGLGTGYTANAGAVDPAVRVTAVELLPQVVAASNAFMLRPGAPRAAHPVDIVTADARRYVQGTGERYDVIVSDLFHPARNGAASLYTAEHFEAVRTRLAPGGLFCQWLALHQMDLETLRSIVAAFLQAYPQGVALLAANSLDSPVIGLVGRPDAPTFALAPVQRRLEESATPALAAAWRLARIDSAYAVLGSLVADSEGLRRFADHATANTDDRPVVAQMAARVGYAPTDLPRERLAQLLRELPLLPAAAIEAGDPAARALGAYWQARARYLDIGMRTRIDPDPRAMLEQLGPDLLALVEQSPRFEPAAESLTQLAQAVQAIDYPLSQRVLAALRQARGDAAAPTSTAPPESASVSR